MIDAIDARAGGGEFCREPVVQALHLLFGIEAARDAGLVGDDEDEPVHRIEAGDGFAGAFNPLKVFDAIDVAAVDVDDAVAVEEESGARGGGHG